MKKSLTLLILVFLLTLPLRTPEGRGEERYGIRLYFYGEDSIEWITGAVAENGDIVVAGLIKLKNSRHDVVIARLSSEGKVKWERVYGSEYSEYVKALRINTNGDIILVGTVDRYDTTRFDAWILCLDPEGNVRWQRTFTGKSSDKLVDVALTEDGSIVSVGTTNTETEWDSVWIVKLRPNGALEWQRMYELYQGQYQGTSTGRAIAIMKNGDILIGGGTRDFALVMKLTQNGSIVWKKLYGAGIINSISVAKNGDILTAGLCYGEKISGCVMKLDPKGNVKWRKTYGAKYYNDIGLELYSIDLADNGDIITGGIANREFPSSLILVLDQNGNLKGHWIWGEKTKDSTSRFSKIHEVYANKRYIVGIGSAVMILPPDGRFTCLGSIEEYKVYTESLSVRADRPSFKIKTSKIEVKRGDMSSKQTMDIQEKVLCTMFPSTKTIPTKSKPIGKESYWMVSYGGGKKDQIRDVAVLPDDNIIAVGTTESFGIGGNDVWVLNLNKNGDIVWQKTYGGKGDDSGHAVAVAPNGDIIVAGSTDSFGAGDYDIWILRLDKNGNIRWETTYGGEYGEGALDIAVMPNGDIIVVGYTGGFGAGGFDAWILRLDSAGNIKWQRSYGGSGEDLALAVDIVKSADIVVAGYTTSFGTGGEDGWILYLDGNGNVKWEKTLGNEGDDEFWGVSVDENEDIITVGFLMGANGYEKAWIVKFDDNGNVKWQKTYEGEEYGDVALNVDTNNGYIAVGGATQNFGTEEAGTWILYLDNEGNIISETVCEEGESWIWSIALTDTSLVAGGFFTSKGSDAAVLKMSPDKPPECSICWKSTATVKTAITQVRSSKAQSENTRGEMAGSMAQVKVSNAEISSHCPVEKENEKETTKTEIWSSESTTIYTHPSSESEEEKGGICGTGAIIVLSLFAAALRRR
ncbi:hypothetical protein VFC49_03990 [Thermococcus sp. SY098]|uniref:hypothetical protein n=1 Tax=Thermococcus sp. SY098 TaxID=3111325 RepID=UPI002D7916BA|nr:hypothetical protein [Thermococcus sp. SY098]WRS53286.1 hypothetical protein VFC49_03990 [Thermococcus sp. SY098]